MQQRYDPLLFTFDEIEDLQCPNCRGYRVQNREDKTWIHILLIFVTWGLWIVVLLLKALFAKFTEPKIPEELKLECKLCGYKWKLNVAEYIASLE